MSTIWQNAPAMALENGFYEGLTPVSEVRQHGDLGIGAWDHLDGEMVGLGGVFYQVTSDGKVHVPDDSSTLPFCMLTHFGGTESYELPVEITHESLPGFMDERLAPDSFYSLRVEGAFTFLLTRSLPRQEKPFAPLAEVTKNEPTFSFERAAGTMVGFRAPAYVGHLAPPGYHLHFISDDRTFGGHVETFAVESAMVTVERVDRHEILYPAL